MKCEIERMEIIYTFYFFAFFEKVIKKLLTFCYWIGQLVLVNTEILDKYLETFHITDSEFYNAYTSYPVTCGAYAI